MTNSTEKSSFLNFRTIVGGIVIAALSSTGFWFGLHNHAKALPQSNRDNIDLNHEYIKNVGFLVAKDIDAAINFHESQERCRDLERDIDRLRAERREVKRSYGEDSEFYQEITEEIEDKQRALDLERENRRSFKTTRVGVIADLYDPTKKGAEAP